MNTYNKAICQMSELLKERKVCLHSRKAHEKCYLELREYLMSNNLNYSLKEARNWLQDVVKVHASKSEFQAKWHYVDQLDELIKTGTVLQDHLLLTKSNYQKLSESWREKLDEYLMSRRNDYTTRSFALTKIRCSGFLLFLQNRGISSIEEVTYESICSFYEHEMPVTTSERYVILSNARQFLQYYVLLKKCEPVLPLLLEEDIYKYSANNKIFTSKTISRIVSETDDFYVCSARKVFDSIDLFCQEFEKHGYKNTAKHNASHIIKCLYAFLAAHDLDYNPVIAERWYEQIESEIGVCYRTWIRMLKLYGKFIQKQEFDLSRKYTFKQSRAAMYPEWCCNAVDGYLEWLERSFHSNSTVRTYKYSVYDFCDYLLKNRIDCFEKLTKSLILAYLNQDKHTTVKGTATRNTILRQFVIYLEDNNFLNDKTLHYVFPNRIAGTTKIITILTEEQVSGINDFRKNCISPIDLRDAAMVMTGLRLGFRASDVINLKLTDIDWINKKVSIVQSKTKVPISLPLSTDVGNAIFRYLKYGRPSCNSNYVFIRHKAPYGKLSGKICSNALNRILHTCGFQSTIKFHSLRKTFATSILRNNAGIERVIDALGHQDMTTVDKYLTFDETHMRKCPLSLSEAAIEMGGADKCF